MLKLHRPLLFMCTLLLLAGCGGGVAEQRDAPLRVWIMNPGSTGPREVMERSVQQFRASHPGVAVEVEYIPWKDAKSKIKNALLGGVEPDVCELGSTWTPEFAEGGVLLDLSSRVAATRWHADLAPALVTSGSWDGHLYGLPWYAGCRALIYRKDFFKEQHLAPPATWDEWVAAAKTLQVKGPGGEVVRYGLGLPGRSAHAFLPLIWSNGGEIMRQANGRWQPAIHEPEALAALRFISELYTVHRVIPEGATAWDAADARSALARGKVAMIIDGPWAIPPMLKLNPEIAGQIGVALPPRSKDFATFAGGSHLVVFRSTRQPDLAWEFAASLLDEGALLDWCVKMGFFPGRISLMDRVVSPEAPWLADFAQVMRSGHSYPPIPAWGRFEEARLYENLFQQLSQGESPGRAAEWVEGEMSRIARE